MNNANTKRASSGRRCKTSRLPWSKNCESSSSFHVWASSSKHLAATAMCPTTHSVRRIGAWGIQSQWRWWCKICRKPRSCKKLLLLLYIFISYSYCIIVLLCIFIYFIYLLGYFAFMVNYKRISLSWVTSELFLSVSTAQCCYSAGLHQFTEPIT